MNAASTVGLILLAGILGMAPASARNCWHHKCDHYCHHSHGNCPDCAQYRSDTGRTTAQAAVQMETIQGGIAEINYLPAPNPDDAVVEVRLDRGSNATVVRLAPSSFLKRDGFALKEGEDLSIRGYRVTVADGNMLVAAEVDRAGHRLALRNSQGRPAWWQKRPSDSRCRA